jgi:hypothetical protein
MIQIHNTSFEQDVNKCLVFVTIVTRRVPVLVEQKLLTLTEHMSSLRFLEGFVLPDSFKIMLFISTGICDDKLRPQIVSVNKYLIMIIYSKIEMRNKIQTRLLYAFSGDVLRS